MVIFQDRHKIPHLFSVIHIEALFCGLLSNSIPTKFHHCEL